MCVCVCSGYVSAKDVQWHGDLPNQPDWSESSRLVAYTINNGDGTGLYIAFNASHMPRVLTMPGQNQGWGGVVWQPLVDTSKLAPYDFLEPDEVCVVHPCTPRHAHTASTRPAGANHA